LDLFFFALISLLPIPVTLPSLAQFACSATFVRRQTVVAVEEQHPIAAMLIMLNYEVNHNSSKTFFKVPH